MKIFLGFAAVLVVMIAIPVLLSWSNSRRRLHVERVGSAVVLRMPRGHHAILASIAIIPFGCIAVLAFSASWAPGSEANRWILGGIMAAAGALLGGYLLALEARGNIRIDDFTIEKVGALRRRQSTWNDVAKLTYNPVNSWFFLTLASGSRVYVVEGMNGIADFAEIALRRLPPGVLAASPDAVEALRDLAAS